MTKTIEDIKNPNLYTGINNTLTKALERNQNKTTSKYEMIKLSQSNLREEEFDNF